MASDDGARPRTSSPPKTKKKTAAVARLIQKQRDEYQDYAERLQPGEKILSNNKVTGASVNFPIAPTCKPTKVCIRTCYFAQGPSSWPASLKKQLRLYNSVCADPEGVGERLVREITSRRTPPTYLRWNGGGDLFAESLPFLHHVAASLPDLPIWVVTRIPEFAAKVKDLSNLYIHFSLDGASLLRRDRFEKLPKASKSYFYSYQCDSGERPDPKSLKGISVLFFDHYKPVGTLGDYPKSIICPLNERSDITGTCESCRRCFDGSAVRHRKRSYRVRER